MTETKKIGEFKLINTYPDMPDTEREEMERQTVSKILKEYNRLESLKERKQ